MIEAGIEAIIISCNTHLGASFLGKPVTADTIALLENKGVDVCGENGEFHTVVINCPLFNHEIEVRQIEKKVYADYCFLVVE